MPCSKRSATWRDQTLKSCRNKLKPASSPGIKTPSHCTCATWILDPAPPARSLTRERSSTPHPPHPTPEEPPRAEPDPLATAVAHAGIELFTDSSDHPPFQGFGTGEASPDYQAYRNSPQHHRFDDSRHERQRSRSSPEPPRKMARRTSSPGPHRSSGPPRPRSRTPRMSISPDPRGRSPNRPPQLGSGALHDQGVRNPHEFGPG